MLKLLMKITKVHVLNLLVPSLLLNETTSVIKLDQINYG